MSGITKHLRANVVGYLALFFAMSAGAYAAGLAPDSVKSKHIRDGHVKAVDTNAGEVQARVGGTCAPGGSIRAIAENGTVTCETVGGVAANSVGADELGPVTTRFGFNLVDGYATRTATASCLAGEELLGGGGGFGNDGGTLYNSQRDGTSNTWTVTSYNRGEDSEVLTAEAICLTQ